MFKFSPPVDVPPKLLCYEVDLKFKKKIEKSCSAFPRHSVLQFERERNRVRCNKIVTFFLLSSTKKKSPEVRGGRTIRSYCVIIIFFLLSEILKTDCAAPPREPSANKELELRQEHMREGTKEVMGI